MLTNSRAQGARCIALSLCDLWQSRSTKCLTNGFSTLLWFHPAAQKETCLFRTVANASDLFIYTPEFPLHKHDATMYIQRIFRLLFTLYICDRVIIKVFRLQRKTLLLLFGFCFPIIIRVFRFNGRLYCYSSSTFGRFWSIFVRAISRELFCQALWISCQRRPSRCYGLF